MNKNAILKHIDFWASRLGSYSAVAKKCDISDASLSTLRAGKYGAADNLLLTKIANALEYKEKRWVTVKTIMNYQRISKAVSEARQEALWVRISNRAGSGKTETLEDIYNQDSSGSVVLIECEEWSSKQFLGKLLEKIGMSVKHYQTQATMLDNVCNYFNSCREIPVLFIDQIDKLKPAARRQLIPLYNKTEDNLAVVASAPESWENEIEKGVRLKKKGWDEIDSRFGRTVITLKGAPFKDIEAICIANGVDSPELIESIWSKLEKVEKLTKVKRGDVYKNVMVAYVEDLRRLKTLIKEARLKQKRAA